jgi:hypothetical protein
MCFAMMFVLILIAKSQQLVAIKTPHGFNRRLSLPTNPQLAAGGAAAGQLTGITEAAKKNGNPNLFKVLLQQRNKRRQERQNDLYEESDEDNKQFTPMLQHQNNHSTITHHHHLLHHNSTHHPSHNHHHNHNHDDTKDSSLANSVVNLGPTGNKDLSKFYFTYDYENGSGELYMRVGTAIFAMATMIDRCLSLIQMVFFQFFLHLKIKKTHS